MKRYRFSALAIAALLLTGCGSGYSKQTADLTAALDASPAAGSEKTDDFIDAQYQFTLAMLQAGNRLQPDENLLYAPYLAAQTLLLAANGAEGETRAEIEALFGGMETDTLNGYFAGWNQSLPETQLTAAHSVWVKDDNAAGIAQDYLQTVQSACRAEVFSAAFDAETVSDMNRWVSTATGGEIPALVETLEPTEVFDLLSTAVFDAAWRDKYADNEVSNAIFYAENARQQNMELMRKTMEDAVYLEDGESAVGLMRDYEGQRFRFGALMPRSGQSLEDYIASLTPEHLREVLNSGRQTEMDTGIPVFTLDTQNDLKPLFQEMGVQAAYQPGAAQFPAICDDLYLNRSVQRAKISVDRHGTKASFALNLGGEKSAAAEYSVYLNHPFIWFIYDRTYGMPVMIGTVESMG